MKIEYQVYSWTVKEFRGGNIHLAYAPHFNLYGFGVTPDSSLSDLEATVKSFIRQRAFSDTPTITTPIQLPADLTDEFISFDYYEELDLLRALGIDIGRFLEALQREIYHNWIGRDIQTNKELKIE